MPDIDTNLKTSAISSNIKAEYSSLKLWIYCLVISLGAFQFGTLSSI